MFGFSIGLQFSTRSLGSLDGYFHARYARIVWDGGVRGFPPAFPWLPLTIRSADRYFDHHMLFHLLLAPFVAGDVLRGAKWASAVFGGVAFVAIYLALRRRGVRHAEWWLLAMFALAPDFAFRMEMPRVQAVSLVWLLLALDALTARRYRSALLLAFGYTWLYDAFPFLLAMAGLCALAIALIEQRIEWRIVAYPLIGVVVGLVANPYFPNDIWFIAQHYLGKVEIGDSMHVGSEWYPYPIPQALGWSGAAVVLVSAAVLVWRARRELDVAKLTTLLMAGMFFVLAWRSRRFIEYAAPFAALGTATTFGETVDRWVRRRSMQHRRALIGLVLIGFAVSAGYAVVQLRRRKPPERYRGGAHWLSGHTPKDSIVFTADWTDFPLLFFHNQRNRYLLGLDPTYLALRDAELYRLWHQLGRGELHPPSAYLPRFDSRVVFSDRTNVDFLRALDGDPAMQRTYEDDDCVIYTRRDE